MSKKISRPVKVLIAFFITYLLIGPAYLYLKSSIKFTNPFRQISVTEVQKDTLYALLSNQDTGLAISDVSLYCTNEKIPLGGCKFDDVLIEYKVDNSERACKQLLTDKEGVRTLMIPPFEIKIGKDISHTDKERRVKEYEKEELYQQCIANAEIAKENDLFASIEGQISDNIFLKFNNQGTKTGLKGVFVKVELVKEKNSVYLIKLLASSNLDPDIADKENLKNVDRYNHTEDSQSLADYTYRIFDQIKPYNYTLKSYKIGCENEDLKNKTCEFPYLTAKFLAPSLKDICIDLLVNKYVGPRSNMAVPSALKIPLAGVKINDKVKRQYAEADILYSHCRDAYNKSIDLAKENQEESYIHDLEGGSFASVSGYLLDGIKASNSIMKMYLTKENNLPYLYIKLYQIK